MRFFKKKFFETSSDFKDEMFLFYLMLHKIKKNRPLFNVDRVMEAVYKEEYKKNKEFLNLNFSSDTSRRNK